ncbi:helix-turn-helix transcriptional regulator [Stenotrophomonas sp. 24(2023)]|uniref:AraC family transcriptional regulator n=1 Tax=Stenotrophomonas sp. 24(2023) TaxID=3068324 RepID=UPI0027DF0D0E|nr:helix-turn-helix transcriptional regulator [Stenotrophomonas sp. 24(2023)]WMJ70934.1 helix-turn-helix transcriptional regulator [Stenotrophomonas sp. 24(2023)]
MADQPNPAPLIDPGLADTPGGPPVVGARLTMAGSRRTPRHQHARGQLLGAASGLLRIEAGPLHWLLPAGHLAWLPPALPHALASIGAFDGWSLYFSADRCAALPDTARLFQPSALLQAAIPRVLGWPAGPLQSTHHRLLGVMADEIAASTPLPLAMPQPADRRLRRIATALARTPHDNRGMDAWASLAGLSTRSLARHWQASTGMGLAEWRQRLRVLLALPRLLEGEAVTTVALSLGYDTPSAFIAVFKRELGLTPTGYTRAMHHDR